MCAFAVKAFSSSNFNLNFDLDFECDFNFTFDFKLYDQETGTLFEANVRATKPKVTKVVKPDYISMPGGVNLKVKWAFVGIEQQQFAEMIVMVVNDKGKGCLVRALLNIGCSKSIILKEFNKQK